MDIALFDLSLTDRRGLAAVLFVLSHCPVFWRVNEPRWGSPSRLEPTLIHDPVFRVLRLRRRDGLRCCLRCCDAIRNRVEVEADLLQPFGRRRFADGPCSPENGVASG